MQATVNPEEKRRYGSIEDFNSKSNNYWDKRFVFVLNHQNVQPSVDGMYFPNSFSLKLEDQIFDKDTEKNRVIRVVRGELSIFKDKQTEEGQKSQPISAQFSKRGDCIVEAKEEQLLEFMMKSNFNGSNPYRNKEKRPIFFMLDLKQGRDAEIKKDKAEAEAANWCYTANFKLILRYARVLGEDIERDPDELRHVLRNLARKDAEKFMDGLNNKHTIRKFYVLEGIDGGLIKVDSRANNISWSNGHVITAAPVGKNPVDHFVDMSFSVPDFDLAYRTLQGLVEPTVENVNETEKGKEAGEAAKTTAPLAPIDINITTDNLVAECAKRKVAVKSGTWFKLGDKTFLGKKFHEAIDADAVFKEKLIALCNEAK